MSISHSTISCTCWRSQYSTKSLTTVCECGNFSSYGRYMTARSTFSLLPYLLKLLMLPGSLLKKIKSVFINGLKNKKQLSSVFLTNLCVNIAQSRFLLKLSEKLVFAYVDFLFVLLAYLTYGMLAIDPG